MDIYPMDIYPRTGVIKAGYIWFAPQLQHTRAATQALFLMLDQATTDLRYRPMQWRCNAGNEKSRCAARRLGVRYARRWTQERPPGGNRPR